MQSVIRVEVTSDDILHGVKGKCSACPIALAIQRMFPDIPVIVYATSASIGNANYDMPDEAIAFIALFDRGEPVSPFGFDLTLWERK